ncbi:MAG TPA: DUF1772 domain-containing protein [Ktedonobacteraceae bacterium]|nr:DUF1772 domain-containing protein [Ktedonobacteraceae bacterium]
METSIVTLIAKGLVCLAILSVGVVYGTDTFFALIGRKALAHSSESAIADVIGHLHEVADARMPIFGAIGLLTSLAFLVIAGLGTTASMLGLVALAVQVLFLVLYTRYSKPINVRLRQAADTHQVPADTRQMQERWDRVVVIRASLLLIVMGCLLLAGVIF